MALSDFTFDAEAFAEAGIDTSKHEYTVLVHFSWIVVTPVQAATEGIERRAAGADREGHRSACGHGGVWRRRRGDETAGGTRHPRGLQGAQRSRAQAPGAVQGEVLLEGVPQGLGIWRHLQGLQHGAASPRRHRQGGSLPAGLELDDTSAQGRAPEKCIDPSAKPRRSRSSGCEARLIRPGAVHQRGTQREVECEIAPRHFGREAWACQARGRFVLHGTRFGTSSGPPEEACQNVTVVFFLSSCLDVAGMSSR